MVNPVVARLAVSRVNEAADLDYMVAFKHDAVVVHSTRQCEEAGQWI